MPHTARHSCVLFSPHVILTFPLINLRKAKTEGASAQLVLALPSTGDE